MHTIYMSSTKQVVLLLFLATIVGAALAAPSGESESCRMEYQRKFQELMTYKQSCADTTLKDCCQTANGAQVLGITANTFIHTINDACAIDTRNFRGGAPPTIKARCDTEEGWMVIMKRNGTVSPLVNFTRLWLDYEDGFGDLNTEFWYGLKNIHCLTQRDDVELMIELKNTDGGSDGVTWTYQIFNVDGPETNYVLHIGGAERIEGGGGDSMAYHNGQAFSTIDRDNDAWGAHCAATENQGNGGGWWYKSCRYTALTRPHTGSNKIHWGAPPYYFPQVEMKIRPKDCLMSGDSCN